MEEKNAPRKIKICSGLRWKLDYFGIQGHRRDTGEVLLRRGPCRKDGGDFWGNPGRTEIPELGKNPYF